MTLWSHILSVFSRNWSAVSTPFSFVPFACKRKNFFYFNQDCIYIVYITFNTCNTHNILLYLRYLKEVSIMYMKSKDFHDDLDSFVDSVISYDGDREYIYRSLYNLSSLLYTQGFLDGCTYKPNSNMEVDHG